MKKFSIIIIFFLFLQNNLNASNIDNIVEKLIKIDMVVDHKI